MQCGELAHRPGTFKIVAGCDTYAPWRERFAEGFPTARVYDEWAALLADPEVELVSIATRSCDHADHAHAALAAGKRVMIEKPMCITFEQARALRESSTRGPGRLYVRHNRRFEATFGVVREIIASGLLGDIALIKLARTSFGRRDDWQTLLACGGGQLGNWGSHIIDHGLQFLGAPEQPLRSIHGCLARVAAVGDAEDHVKIVLTGQTGTVVDIEISGGAALPSPTYLIWGSRGALEGSDDQVRLRYLDPKQPLAPRTAFAGVPGSEFTLPNGELALDARKIGANFGTPETLPWIVEDRPVPPLDPGAIWDALYADIREGIPFPITLDQAVEVIRVSDAVRRDTPFSV